MLTENDVVEAVARHLEEQGWQITDTSYTDQRGYDVLARRDGIGLAVEAKGGTSSKPGTKRYGKPFTPNQKFDHVAKALYTAARVFSAGQHRAAIALPSDAEHRQLVDDIVSALAALGVGVFLVAGDLTVHELMISN